MYYYIQTLHHEGKLTPDQQPGELNPLFKTTINPHPSHTTWKDQSCFSLQPGHFSNLTALNVQPNATQGMYNFKFTILINTNYTSNHQPTNETHYTQHNTMFTTINRNTLPATTKRQRTSHRTHTTKNHNFILTLPHPSLQNQTTNVVINIIVANSLC